MGIAVCLCLSCTRMRGGQEGVVLDLTETGTDTLGFGDVFDVVGVVPLETKNECLLGHVSKVEVVDGNYYVLDGQRKAVFVFDGQGAFLRRIGIMGHGHGEYERASDFTVDRDRRRVVILCGPREVYMYDLQGQFVGKKDVGPWWGYYPGYLYPGYWGGNWGGGWYYPYPITYSYSTGSLLADMINLKNAPEGQKEKLTVVWNAYISGLLGGSGSLNVNRTTTAINQAFTQSPYLKK